MRTQVKARDLEYILVGLMRAQVKVLNRHHRTWRPAQSDCRFSRKRYAIKNAASVTCVPHC